MRSVKSVLSVDSIPSHAMPSHPRLGLADKNAQQLAKVTRNRTSQSVNALKTVVVFLVCNIFHSHCSQPEPTNRLCVKSVGLTLVRQSGCALLFPPNILHHLQVVLCSHTSPSPPPLLLEQLKNVVPGNNNDDQRDVQLWYFFFYEVFTYAFRFMPTNAWTYARIHDKNGTALEWIPRLIYLHR